MEDRELLELSAKAAGYEVEWVRNSGCFYRCEEEIGREEWNPLEDDGDALRLAVSLQLSVCNEHVTAGGVYCIDASEKDYPVVDSGDKEDHVIASDYAATRRAIVRAAAEIGKAMP